MALSNGTGYTNLQNYINANKGNRLGNVINNGIGGVVGEGKKELDTQRNTFQTGMGAENNRLNTLYTGGQNTLNELNSSPKTIDDKDIKAFRDSVEARYQGPQGLSDEAGLQRKTTNINEVGGLAGSRAGRGQLLKTFINSPNYTRNKEELDSLLLGPNVDTTLRGAKHQGQQLGGDIQSTLAGAKGQVQATQTGIQPHVQQLNTNVNDIGNNLTKSLTDRANEKQKEADAFQARLNQQDLAGLGYGMGNSMPKPTNVELSQLQAAKKYGGGDDYWSSLVNPTFAQNISPSGVANDEDRAKATALAKLSNNPSYNQYATGPAYTGSSVTLDANRANENAMGLYGKVNEMKLPELAKYNQELNPIVSSWQDPGRFNLNSAIDLFKGYNNPNSVSDYVNLQKLYSKIRNEFGIGVTPTTTPTVSPAGKDRGYIKP